ncbi:MAG TPA: DUF934 domain-containing protein [Burkholderiaceae bacterium]
MKFIDRTQDRWQLQPDAEIAGPSPDRLLTLAQWEAVRDSWPADVPVGVLLPNTADVEDIARDLPRLALVALDFPKWVDGRAYSQAHVLRARLRYAGEIRATGDVVVDMMLQLRRTGFDAVVLREGQRQSSAERALGFFPGFYQGDVLQPQPRFARAEAQS